MKTNDRTVFSRILREVQKHPKSDLPRIFSQKIQRRILHSYLLGPKRSHERVRLNFIKNIDRALNGALLDENNGNKRILEVGCGRGRDFLKYLDDRDEVELFGVDLKWRQELDNVNNLTFIKADAESIPLPDKYIDIGVSIGVLEHIQPIEKLSKVLLEVSRVCKRFVHLVPAASTLWEPHTGVRRWQLKQVEKKVGYEAPLLFLSDEAWLSFEALRDCKSFHFDTVPVFCTALAIHSHP